MISHWGLIYISLQTDDIEHLFTCLLVILTVSLGRMLICSFIVLGMDPRDVHMLGKCSTMDLYPSLWVLDTGSWLYRSCLAWNSLSCLYRWGYRHVCTTTPGSLILIVSCVYCWVIRILYQDTSKLHASLFSHHELLIFISFISSLQYRQALYP